MLRDECSGSYANYSRMHEEICGLGDTARNNALLFSITVAVCSFKNSP